MRWILVFLVLAVAGGAVWWWAQRDDDVRNDLDFIFDVETGEIVPRTRMKGLEQTGVVPLGIIGQVPRPREPLGNQDRWMTAPLILPATKSISGKSVLQAMSKLTPIRFRDQAEMTAFENGAFEDLGNEGADEVHGQIFEDLAGHLGYKVEIKDQFLFVYNPDNNKAFRDRLLAARKRNKEAEGSK